MSYANPGYGCRGWIGGGGGGVIETEGHSSYPALAFYFIILALIPMCVS